MHQTNQPIVLIGQSLVFPLCLLELLIEPVGISPQNLILADLRSGSLDCLQELNLFLIYFQRLLEVPMHFEHNCLTLIGLNQVLQVVIIPQEHGFFISDSLLGGLISPIVESLSQGAIYERALPFLYIDFLDLEEIVNVEDHIFL